MKKVVHINMKKFLGGYSSVQNSERIPGDALFLAGVASTTVIPVIAYCANGGPVPPLVFAGVALIGTFMGLIKYRLLPPDVVTRLGVNNLTHTPSDEVPLKKAS